MKPADRTFLLAIESGVAGGSVALYHDGTVIDRWVGPTDTSRAEDLLAAIDEICVRSGGGFASLNNIAVSTGPGSYTGLRIGIATALGLAKGIGIECVGVPLLEALAALAKEGSEVISAVPMGKADVCFQRFDSLKLKVTEAASASLQDFEKMLADFPDACLVVPQSLQFLGSRLVADAGNCIAQHIAAYTDNMRVSYGMDPIYVQNPRML